MRVCQAFVREWGALENPKFGSYYDLCQQLKRQIRKRLLRMHVISTDGTWQTSRFLHEKRLLNVYDLGSVPREFDIQG